MMNFVFVVFFFSFFITRGQSQVIPNDHQETLKRCKREATCAEKCDRDNGCPTVLTHPAMFVGCGYKEPSELTIEIHLLAASSKAPVGTFVVEKYSDWSNGECEAFFASFDGFPRYATIETAGLRGTIEKSLPETLKDYILSKRIYVSVEKGNCITECKLGKII